jgi:hypothetical protein
MIAGDVEEGFEDVGEEFFGSSSQRQADLAPINNKATYDGILFRHWLQSTSLKVVR